MKIEKGMLRIDPFEYFMYYHDLEPMEKFEIKNMSDSPYHFNYSRMLINKDGECRNEILLAIMNEPKRVKKIIPRKEVTLMLSDEEEEAVKKFVGIGWLGTGLRNEQ